MATGLVLSMCLGGAAQAATIGSRLNPADFASLGTLNLSSGAITFNTDSLTATGFSNGVLASSQSGTSQIAVFTFDSVKLTGTVTVSIVGARPIALLSKGSIDVGVVVRVDGGTSIGASGGTAGPGGNRGGNAGVQGTGPGAGRYGSSDAGGGGGYGGAGGMGADASAGGLAYGDAVLTELAGGSGGGGGGGTTAGGGGGAGAIELVAASSLTIQAGGSISASGGQGYTVTVSGTYPGGGGSGGAIILSAPTIINLGSVLAKGGAGGSAPVSGAAYDGAGGGGGGRVAIYSDVLTQGTISVVGGSGGTADNPGQTGGTGTIYRYAPAPPVASDVTATNSAGAASDITLKATDDGQPNPPGALTYTIMSLPANGTLEEPGVGAITSVPYALAVGAKIVTYTGAADYAGADSFTFKANDGGTPPAGGDSNVATVSITVKGCPAPVPPSSPVPADGAVNVDLNADLSWSPGTSGLLGLKEAAPVIDPKLEWWKAEEPHDFCATEERYLARVMAAGWTTDAALCATQGPCDAPNERDLHVPDPSTPIKTYRIFIHVFCDDSGANCAATQASVDGQMATVNENYLPWRIQFVYETEFINSTLYRYWTPSEEAGMKQAYAKTPTEKLNVFVVNNSSSYSVATFPWDPDCLTYMGGIVMHEPMFGPGVHTLTHEIGHCLGLWHTHHGVSEVSGCTDCHEYAGGTNGDYTGDFCSQTPPTPTNYNCAAPGGTDSCNGVSWGTTSFHNYMGYAPSACRSEFVTQQAGRFHCWSEQVLTGWLAPSTTCPTTYDVYFDTVNPPVAKLCSDVSVLKCDPGTLNVATTYYWKVVAKNAKGTVEGPVWTFGSRLCAPAPTPTSPNPASGATGVAVDKALAWGPNPTGGETQDCGTTYDVYVGTTNPPATKVAGDLTAPLYQPSAAWLKDTTYYWKVVAKNAGGPTNGPVWSFATVSACLPPAAPTNPTPANNATNVAIDISLAWNTAGDSGESQDPPALACEVTYDVYLGTVNPPTAKVASNLTSSTWKPTTSLATKATYYWKVVAKNAGGQTNGPVWTFVTRECGAPSMAFNPDPADAATLVPVDKALAWNANGAQYFEDFSDGLAQGWVEEVDAYWNVVNQEYRSTSPSEAFYTGQEWTNLKLEADLRASSASDAPRYIAVRATSGFGDYPYAGNAYAFGISAGNEYYILRITPTNTAVLKTWTVSPYIKTATEWNRLGAEVVGSSIKFFINGNLVWSGSDSVLTSGRIALWPLAGTHYYDNITVSIPTASSTASISPLQEWYNEHPSGGDDLSGPNGEPAPVPPAYLLESADALACDLTYDVYLGTTNPPTTKVASDLTTATYQPPSALAYSTTYYWRVVTKSAGGETTGSVWRFTTVSDCTPPAAPSNPSPADKATSVAIGSVLAWNASANEQSFDAVIGLNTAGGPPFTATELDGSSTGLACEVTYDLYLGTVNPPTAKVASDLTTTSWSSGTVLAKDTTYYWKVVAKSAGGQTSGPVWSFSTVTACLPPTVPGNPTPSNGAVEATLLSKLSWTSSGGTCAVTYDLYLDKVNPPVVKVATALSSSSYQPPAALAESTIYYWRVVARTLGGETTGPVWNFKTLSTCPLPQEPNGPSPAAGAVGVKVDTQLSWAAAAASFGAPRTAEEMEQLAAQFAASGSTENGGDRPTIAPYSAQTIESAATGTVNILAFTGHSDNNVGGEYENMLSALAQHFGDFTVTRTTTEAAATLATELTGKDVFLVPEQENWTSALMSAWGTSVGSVLQNFANTGGVVIVADDGDGARSDLFLVASGLLNAGNASGGNYSNRWSLVTAPNHPIMLGMPSGFYAANGNTNYPGTPDGVILATSNSNPLVIAKQIGSGGVVLMGFDFYQYNVDMARILANAVQWLGPPRCPPVYDVYLDTVNPPVTKVAADLTAPPFQPTSALAENTQYFWQVVAKNAKGQKAGPVWSFSTTYDLHYELVVVNAPSASGATVLPVSASSVTQDAPFYVEFWARDEGGLNTGLSGVFADVEYPADKVEVTEIIHVAPFDSLGTSGTNLSGMVDELGGSTETGQVGVEPAWACVARLKMNVKPDACISTGGCAAMAAFSLKPASSACSAYGRGVISADHIRFGQASVAVQRYCLYDLTHDCLISEPDLALLTPGWLSCSGQPAYLAANDFDCSGCVGAGDIGWFATGWLRSCGATGIVYPTCKCSSGGGNSVTGNVQLTYRVRPTLPATETASTLPVTPIVSLDAGQRCYVEVWARDLARGSEGLAAVLADVTINADGLMPVEVSHGTIFKHLVSGTIQANVVSQLGGANLNPGVATGTWTRVAVVALQASKPVEVGSGVVQLSPTGLDPVGRIGSGSVERSFVGVCPNFGADLDGDCGIDTADCSAFAACLTGPGVPQPELNCQPVDFDRDGDVDLSDFGKFQRCLTEPGQAIDVSCLQD